MTYESRQTTSLNFSFTHLLKSLNFVTLKFPYFFILQRRWKDWEWHGENNHRREKNELQVNSDFFLGNPATTETVLKTEGVSLAYTYSWPSEGMKISTDLSP